MRHAPDNDLLAASQIYSRLIDVGKMLGAGVLIAAFWYALVLLKA